MTQLTSTIPPAIDDTKTRKVELVLQQLDTLPTLPIVALKLMALTGATDSKIEEVVQILSMDPSLTCTLLSLANSAEAGSHLPITTVRQAVVMLGFETLRNLVLSVKVFEVFQQRSEAAEPAQGGEAPVKDVFDRTEFWKHSLAVATAAEMIAARSRVKMNVHDAFVCGLLHDIGKVAFDTAMPKSFARVIEVALMTRGDIADLERRIIGLDHGLAGKRLAEAWNLPQVITQAIWLHGAPPPSTAQAGGMAGSIKGVAAGNTGIVLAVALADVLVRRQHIGFSGNFLFPYETREYARHLGLTDKDVAEITKNLAEQLEIRAKAIGLYDVDSRQVYLQSIANANSELGRVNQQLGLQNRKLAVRSECFEMMTRFYQRITPAASPAQLLCEIGYVANGFLDSGRLVLFSQDPDQVGAEKGGLSGIGSESGAGVGEVLTFDTSKAVQDSFLMSMPRYGNDQRVGTSRANQNFTRPAAPQFDWLLERVQPFFGTSHCWFMPILCGNEPVGGILWLAKEGQPGNSLAGIADLVLVSQAWGMTLRTAQIREQQTLLTESLAGANRELGALQQQLVRAKSLSGLGEMAAGAAHEMNNPLAIICGRAQLLASKMKDATMKQEATLIAQQGDRLSQIITDMMEFAKPQPPKVAEYRIEAAVEEAVRLAEERAGAGAAVVKVEVAAGIPEGRGDVKQISNAIMEVVLNALQSTRAAAMARGMEESGAGRVDPGIAIPGLSLGEVLVRGRFDPMDHQIIIQVTDHGIGMTEDVMRQAFSPFYSAKKAGRNRGLGLPKALRWMENHGGTIRLDSAVGEGTTAVLLLPVG